MPYSITFQGSANTLDLSDRNFASITCRVTNDDVANAPPCICQVFRNGQTQPQNYNVPPLAIGASYSFTMLDKWQAQEAHINATGTNDVATAHRYDDSLASYSNQTTSVNGSTALDMFPGTTQTADAMYFSNATRFNELDLNLTTAGAGTYLLIWEYWNGTAWVALPDFIDNSDGCHSSIASFTLRWGMPTNWVVNDPASTGTTRFNIRCRPNMDGSRTLTTMPQINNADVMPAANALDWSIMCNGRHTTGGTGTIPGTTEVIVSIEAHVRGMRVQT